MSEWVQRSQSCLCRNCVYYYITWDPRKPYGCKALGFKCREWPARVVYAVTWVGLKPVVKIRGVAVFGATVGGDAARSRSNTSTVPGWKRTRPGSTRFEVATNRRPAATAVPAVKVVK